ncbi:MAG: 6-bladed beta-propeller [Acidobacteriota bacterium]|jgi:hypothetical protein
MQTRPLPFPGLVLTLGALAASTLACAPPLEFAEWTVPVPEGTPVVEYAGVDAAQRAGHRIEARDDLVIAPRAGDDNYSFYLPSAVMADSNGTIYVLDSGEARVQVYGSDGNYLRTIGKQGSGPGEFRGNQGGFVTVLATIAADRLIVYDMSLQRLSVWDRAGTHQGDHLLPEPRLGRLVAGRDDGGIVATTLQRVEDGSNTAVIALDTNGEVQRDYVSLARPGTLDVDERRILDPSGGPAFAAAPDGTVYATAGDQYQVIAVAPDGSTRWALRVAQERVPFTDADRRRILDVLSNNGEAPVDAAGTDWPAYLASISRLSVDGHGHLYVFGPTPPFAEAPGEVDVEVYAADGKRLFTGTMPPVRWSDAVGDFVYGTRTNEATDEREVVRYRLVEPFAP